MAYKYQLGMARMSGSLVQDGGFEVRDDDDTQRFAVARDTGNTTVGGTLTAAGITSTAAANSLGATSFNDADISNVGAISLDTISADGASFAFGSNWTAASRTCADLGTVTTADINGGNIDGTVIGATSVAAGSFAAVVGTTGTYSGVLKTDDTTDATSKTDGSLQTDGGLSVAKAIYNGTAATLAADSGVVTIGSATSATFSAAGLLNINNATEATTATDGSLQTDGGLSVVKSAVIGDDLYLLSDTSILNFGADKDVNLTHVADTGLLLNSTRQLQFGDSGTHIAQSADGVLKLTSDAEVQLSVGAAGMTVKGTTPRITIGDADAEDSSVVFDGNAQDYYVGLDDTDDMLKIGLGSTLGTTPAILVDSSQNVTIENDGFVGDDFTLKSDAAVLGFGADTDTTLTHVADTGLLMNSTRKIQFNDSSQYIGASSAADLDLAATTDINMDCTTVDVNAALDVSGATTLNGTVTLGNATADDITFTGYAASHLVPKTDSTYNLGSNALRWSTIYVDSIVGADVAFDFEAVGPGDTIASSTDYALVTGSQVGTVTMPAASVGKRVYIKLGNACANMTIAAAGGDAFPEVTGSLILESTGSAVTLVAIDGTNWYIQ